MSIELSYKLPGPVAAACFKSKAFVRGIRGPVGSGKSSLCCWVLMDIARAQLPDPDGIRRTKFAIVRRTLIELRTTTIKTWLMWFKTKHFPDFRWSPPLGHTIRIGDVETEITFMALDTEADLDKLRSAEFTAIWINEARELDKNVIDVCTERVNRFPSMKDGGPGPTRPGVIMDTNAPEDEHWWPIMAGEVPAPEWMGEEDILSLAKPDDWEFFSQPPAVLDRRDSANRLIGYEVNPKAENLKGLTEGYYQKLITGKSRRYIKVQVQNILGHLEDTRAVYPAFNREMHLSKGRLVWNPKLDTVVGIDFGRTPAAVVMQKDYHGRWVVLREYLASNMGIRRFALLVLLPGLVRDFPGLLTGVPAAVPYQGALMSQEQHEQIMTDWARRVKLAGLVIWGDPAGDELPQTDEQTPFQILRAIGLPANPAPSNDPTLRIEAVDGLLGRLVDGVPGIVIDAIGCPVLVAGFEGRYRYRKIQSSTGVVFDNKPLKDRFSHVQDAAQYAVIGGGEGVRLISRPEPAPVVIAGRSYRPFAGSGTLSRIARRW